MRCRRRHAYLAVAQASESEEAPFRLIWTNVHTRKIVENRLFRCTRLAIKGADAALGIKLNLHCLQESARGVTMSSMRAVRSLLRIQSIVEVRGQGQLRRRYLDYDVFGLSSELTLLISHSYSLHYRQTYAIMLSLRDFLLCVTDLCTQHLLTLDFRHDVDSQNVIKVSRSALQNGSSFSIRIVHNILVHNRVPI